MAAAYISAIRVDAVFLGGVPRHPDRHLPTALRNSGRTLAQLRQVLVKHAARLPSRNGLKRLTQSLEQGLVSGEAAQHPFALAAKDVLSGADTTAGDRRLTRLRARGLIQLRRSAAAMATFSLGANKLGAALFAQAL
jgi:hypothetical protein